jgi:hypothetical protein
VYGFSFLRGIRMDNSKTIYLIVWKDLNGKQIIRVAFEDEDRAYAYIEQIIKYDDRLSYTVKPITLFC